MELKREIKLALVGDARVGKTSWVSRHIDGEESPHYIPTIGYKCRQCLFPTNLGEFMFDIWDISGSHSTAQDRAKWIHDIDAAIIMVDMANLASIENAVNWYIAAFSLELEKQRAEMDEATKGFQLPDDDDAEL
ncbi:hypothetical protein N7466_003574 [Penicillium verhagenii]|uniref:uncharacterized protein n=1 Tax=Penicillium verhagenii TaxID=1562060 RepID=UPI0025453441|nr:uncharacterized protein N7466_003574 [Penicillium verhagenii]KAJ5937124.1 hypothetical protein N7466_003574 [Penicillium verhagenii]